MIMMMRRRRRRTLRTDNGKDYCDEVTMMKSRTGTYIWFSLDDMLFITSDIITNDRYTVIRVPSHQYQHSTII